MKGMFEATIQGNRGPISRMGTHQSGIVASIKSVYKGHLNIRVENQYGTTMCTISVRGNGSTTEKILYCGRWYDLFDANVKMTKKCSNFTPAEGIEVLT